LEAAVLVQEATVLMVLLDMAAAVVL